MRIDNVAQYNVIKQKLQEIGFTNVPAADGLVINADNPVLVNATMLFKRQIVQDESVTLFPVN